MISGNIGHSFFWPPLSGHTKMPSSQANR